MLRMVTVVGVAALAAAGGAQAQDDDYVDLDRLALADGQATVAVSRDLAGRKVDFAFSISRSQTQGEDVTESGGESFDSVRLADRRRPARLRVVSSLCDEPVAIVGTLTRRVARVELVAADGTVTKLPRHKAPARWGFRGRVVGSVQADDGFREVRAKLRGGKVVARVKPGVGTPCPTP